MIENFVIPPTTLTLATTFKCTAACKDCCFACTPKRKEKLSLEEMISYIDQATDSFKSIKVFVLTGGESFLLGRELEKVVKYAYSKGLSVRIVTNGYWAKNYNVAFEKLKKLVDKGLKEINFSTGDDHLKFVPYDNIINGIMASMELGLTTVVNVECSPISNFNSKTLKEDPILAKYLDESVNNKLQILNGVWMPFTKSTNNKLNSIDDIDKKILP